MKVRILIIAGIIVQFLCAMSFVYETFGSLLGLRTESLDWTVHEVIQVGTALGLFIGMGFSTFALVRSDSRRKHAEGKLVALSGAFHDLLEQRFCEWGLTPAEHDIAYFIIKGFSAREIAGFRSKSEGTIKAQTAAVYRKAGVSGKMQLAALFLDELMGEPLWLKGQGDSKLAANSNTN